jgi:hypothetical protein
MLILIFLSYSFGDLTDDISDFWDGLNDIGGPTGFEILQLDMHARTNGTAGNSWSGGVHSLFENPSEIMHSSDNLYNGYNFAFSYKKLFLDMNANFVGFSAKRGNHAFGISFLGFFSGDMELRDNSPGDPLGNYSGDDIILGLTYAKNFGDLSIGSTFRTLNSRIFEVSYSTYSFDLGISRSFKAFKDRDFRLDLSFLHLGPKYGPEGADEEFRLPTTWHLGLKSNFDPLFIGVSANKPLNTELQYTIGVEYKITEYFSIRAGGKDNNPLERYSFGLGLHKNNMCFDYAFAPTVIDVEGSHILTFSIGL